MPGEFGEVAWSSHAEQRGKKGMAGLGKGPSWRHTVGDREEAHVRVLARRQIVQC